MRPLAIIVLAAVFIAFTAAFTFDQFAFSGDEYSYLFQARILESGHLYAQPPLAEPFVLQHIINLNGKWYGRYTPGWPLMLAIGEKLHMSWLLKAAIGGLALFAIYTLAKRLHGSRTALYAVAMLAVSPFFTFNAASFYPHTASLLFSAIFMLFFFKSLQKSSKLSQLISGASLGFVFMIRPVDAAITGLPFAAYAFLTVRDKTDLAKKTWLLISAAGMVAGIQLAINLFFTKSPFTFTYQVYDPAERFAINAKAVGQLLYRLKLLAVWMPLSALAIFAKRQKVNFLFASVIAVNIITYLLFPFTGGDQFGPRYYFPSVISIAVLAGSTLSRIKTQKYLIPALLVVSIPLVAFHTADLHREVEFREQLYDEVNGQTNLLVIIKSSEEQGCSWYTRNSPKLEGNIYVCDMEGSNDDLIEKFPGKTPYFYDLAEMGRSGTFYSRMLIYS